MKEIIRKSMRDFICGGTWYGTILILLGAVLVINFFYTTLGFLGWLILIILHFYLADKNQYWKEGTREVIALQVGLLYVVLDLFFPSNFLLDILNF